MAAQAAVQVVKQFVSRAAVRPPVPIAMVVLAVRDPASTVRPPTEPALPVSAQEDAAQTELPPTGPAPTKTQPQLLQPQAQPSMQPPTRRAVATVPMLTPDPSTPMRPPRMAASNRPAERFQQSSRTSGTREWRRSPPHRAPRAGPCTSYRQCEREWATRCSLARGLFRWSDRRKGLFPRSHAQLYVPLTPMSAFSSTRSATGREQ